MDLWKNPDKMSEQELRREVKEWRRSSEKLEKIEAVTNRAASDRSYDGNLIDDIRDIIDGREKKTLEQKTPNTDNISVEFIDYEICGDYWKVMQGERELGIVYESDEGWATETCTGMSWDMIDTKEQAIELIIEESEDVCSLCGR